MEVCHEKIKEIISRYKMSKRVLDGKPDFITILMSITMTPKNSLTKISLFLLLLSSYFIIV